METATLTLTDFLLARIAEDEMAISCDDCGAPYGMHEDECGGYLTVRALTECEAKRALIEPHLKVGKVHYPWRYHPSDGFDVPVCAACGGPVGCCDTLRTFASIYADHPDYRDEWKPTTRPA